jgi:hypothetical protein
VKGRVVEAPAAASRLVRTVAACFDSQLSGPARRHAQAV